MEFFLGVYEDYFEWTTPRFIHLASLYEEFVSNYWRHSSSNFVMDSGRWVASAFFSNGQQFTRPHSKFYANILAPRTSLVSRNIFTLPVWVTRLLEEQVAMAGWNDTNSDRFDDASGSCCSALIYLGCSSTRKEDVGLHTSAGFTPFISGCSRIDRHLPARAAICGTGAPLREWLVTWPLPAPDRVQSNFERPRAVWERRACPPVGRDTKKWASWHSISGLACCWQIGHTSRIHLHSCHHAGGGRLSVSTWEHSAGS